MFHDEPLLLHLTPPLTVIRDIHRQFHDLMRLFQLSGRISAHRYLFFGDDVDQAPASWR
jgi:serine/threonine-protein phosphatase PP1 catalytic subunit